MGMDVYGKNPKLNKTIEEFPIYHKYNNMNLEDKWKKLEENKTLRTKYWKEQQAFEEVNCGNYFRYYCWWWRPLWTYCYAIADDIISYEVWNSGHMNDGAGLNAEDAERLGKRILNHIDTGECVKYQAEYMQHLDDIPDDNCWKCNNNNRGKNKKKDCDRCDGKGTQESMNKSYPFDTDNVRRFANFCIESGGFEIC